MKNDMSQDTKDALEMSGLPLIQFEPPSRQIIQTRQGEFKQVTTTGWVKLALAFRNVLALLGGPRLAVFLSICLHVNDKGESWPAIRTIAAETGLNKSTVSKSVKELEKIPGLLPVERRGGTSNLYRPSFVVYGQSVHTPPVKPYTVYAQERTEVESIKKNQEEEKPSPRKRGGDPEVMALSEKFVTLTGIPWLEPKTKAEWSKASKLWIGPLKAMIAVANGQSDLILESAVRQMRKEGLTIFAPASVEKVFVSIYGEKHKTIQAKQDFDPFAGFHRMIDERKSDENNR